MSWIDPVLDWNTTRAPTEADLNRIEGNTNYLKDSVDVLEGIGTAQGVGTDDDVAFNSVDSAGDVSGTTGTFSGALTGTTLNTGQGANELYDMNQNVTTASAVTFGTVVSSGTVSAGGGVSSSAGFFGVDDIETSTGDITASNGHISGHSMSTAGGSLTLEGSFYPDITAEAYINVPGSGTYTLDPGVYMFEKVSGVSVQARINSVWYTVETGVVFCRDYQTRLSNAELSTATVHYQQF